MTPEQVAFNRRWIAALRSGDFAQTRGIHKLERPPGAAYCVLGLGYSLCPRATFTKLYPSAEAYPENAKYYAGPGSGESNIPHTLVAASGWAPEVLVRAMEMNDHRYSSFSEIADYLESQLP